MKFFSVLFSPLLLVVLITSCQKDNEVTGIVPNEKLVYGVQSDTFSINTYSVESDSIPSYGSTKFIGTYHSSETGKTSCKSYFALVPKEVGIKYNGSLLVEKVVLSFKVTEAYGTAVNQNFEVLQVTEQFGAGRLYYTNDSLAYGINSFGTFQLDSKDTGNYEFVLDNSFGDLLLAEGASIMESETAFSEFFKGIVIVPATFSQTDKGVIYSISASSVKVSLFYSDTDLSGTVKDTLVFHQPTASKSFFTVTKDISGSQLEGGVNNLSAGKSQFYLQGLGGAKARIDFPYLKAWYQNKAINRATIYIPSLNSANSDYSLPSAINMHELSNSTSIGVSLSYDSGSNCFKGDIHNSLTTYLEAGKDMNFNISIPNSYATAKQLVLAGNGNVSNPSKLVIYYTEYK